MQNWGTYAPGYDEASFVNSTIPFAQAYMTASIAQAAYLNKPVVMEEFGFPRDLGSLSAEASVSRRDIYYSAVFDVLLASASTQGALAGVNFWAYGGEGRPAARGVPGTPSQLCTGARIGNGSAAPLSFTGAQPDWGACFTAQDARPRACGADTWWATRAAWPAGAYYGQDVWMGDPPHESQNWYSVLNTDTTMGVIATYAKQMNASMTCASTAVRTSLLNTSVPGSQAGAIACTSLVPSGCAGNLC